MGFLELSRRVIPDKPRRAMAKQVRRYRNRRAKGDEIRELWNRGVSEEIEYWRNWIATRGAGNDQDYEVRMSSTSPLQDYIRRLLPDASAQVKLLDVGAGPVTSLGKTWAGHEVEIIAVDALAHQYTALFDEMGVSPPVATRFCHSERLADSFDADTFDLVLACNTLDHSYDPMLAIQQMLTITHPGGVVLLEHHPNEAENEGYTGMHQWNMDVVDGECIIWRPGVRLSITDVLGSVASITGTKDPAARGFGLVTMTITKR
ncbi:MAG: methyltransferase domain-containing protein [Acidimicrobiales bacterium]